MHKIKMGKNNFIKKVFSEKPAEKAGEVLSLFLLEKKEKDILFLLSGGSAFDILPFIEISKAPSSLTLSVLDERYTEKKENQNTEKLFSSLFYKKMKEKGAFFFDARKRECESLEQNAKRFDLFLKEWHIRHPFGIVCTTLGMGEDGHTAGILPYAFNEETFSSFFFKNGVCAVGYSYQGETEHKERITTTLFYLKRHSDFCLFYVVGGKKKKVIEKLFSEENLSYREMPAKIIKEMQNVIFIQKG
jgi:6-phosphogluconolactonase/glucosamine-6-phosphate isomerase/deaminase